MSRRYQHTIELLPQIREMLNQGMTQKEVENALGLVGDRPIHNLLKRERKKELQGIGSKFIEKIEGSYSSVIGLDIEKLKETILGTVPLLFRTETKGDCPES